MQRLNVFLYFFLSIIFILVESCTAKFEYKPGDAEEDFETDFEQTDKVDLDSMDLYDSTDENEEIQCTSPLECQDGNECNGEEKCNRNGKCAPADFSPPDGTYCEINSPGIKICFNERCVTSICGDGITDPRNGETCDDQNNDPSDGCDECQLECQNDEDCNDGDICNGIEKCDLSSHRCLPGGVEDYQPDGISCTKPGINNGICLSHTCVESRCGDGFVDSNREECEMDEVRACGNCGIERCQSCHWSGNCENQGICSPGSTDSKSCGNCGTQIRTCNSSCQWDSWGSCTGEGVCTPHATEQRNCGYCGYQTRRCLENCQWEIWSECQNPGECLPGDARVCSIGQCTGGTQTCNDSCQWGECFFVSHANDDTCNASTNPQLDYNGIHYGSTCGSHNDYNPGITPSCQGEGGEVAYRFSLNNFYIVSADLCNTSSAWDTVMYILKGNCSSSPLSLIECNDNGFNPSCSQPVLSSIKTILDPGDYYLIVDGRSSSDQGPFTLNFSEISPSSCTDNFLVFDAPGDSVTFSDNDNFSFNTAFTMEAWLKLQRGALSNGRIQIIGKWGTSAGENEYSMEIQKGSSSGEIPADTIGCVFDDGAIDGSETKVKVYFPISGLPDDTWFYIACVINTNFGQARILLNGQIKYETTFSPDDFPQFRNGPSDLKFGESYWTSPHFVGSINEVRFWNRARTDKEIRDNMLCKFNSPYPSDLQAYFPFDEGPPSITTNEVTHVPPIIGTITNEAASGDMWANETIKVCSDTHNCPPFPPP